MEGMVSALETRQEKSDQTSLQFSKNQFSDRWNCLKAWDLALKIWRFWLQGKWYFDVDQHGN